jgi:hypothetical protein
MSDSIALPLLAVIAVALVALALVWPQGDGARSPPPFGHRMAPMPVSLPPMPKGPILLRGPEPTAKTGRH